MNSSFRGRRGKDKFNNTLDQESNPIKPNFYDRQKSSKYTPKEKDKISRVKKYHHTFPEIDQITPKYF